jgi:glucokinase
MEKVVIGIDIGGTNLKGIVMEKNGTAHHLTRIPTQAERGGVQILQNVMKVIDSLVLLEGSREHILGIGIGTPGFVSLDGVISGAGNLPGWKGTQLYKLVRERFGMNVVAANDVTVMALAEARYGAGRGVANMVCFAIGTGIGGGIVIDRKLYAGTHGMAGELGHMPVEPGGIPCNCGQIGCVERYASATGIVSMAKELAGRAEGTEVSPFVKTVHANPGTLTSKTVYEFVAKGDTVACAVHERVCEMLARAVGITISALSPDRVVLGGGVMMAGQVIIDGVKKYLPRYTMQEMLEKCDIVAAELGEDAGVIGAAAMAFDAFYE